MDRSSPSSLSLRIVEAVIAAYQGGALGEREAMEIIAFVLASNGSPITGTTFGAFGAGTSPDVAGARHGTGGFGTPYGGGRGGMTAGVTGARHGTGGFGTPYGGGVEERRLEGGAYAAVLRRSQRATALAPTRRATALAPTRRAAARRPRGGGTGALPLLMLVIAAAIVLLVAQYGGDSMHRIGAAIGGRSVSPDEGWTQRRRNGSDDHYAVYGPPTIDRGRYRATLAAARHPMEQEGDAAYDTLVQLNIDPAIHLALLLADSARAGDLAHPPPRGGYNPHDLRLCPTCGSAVFSSYVECVERWAEAVKRETGGGDIVVDDILRVQFGPDDNVDAVIRRVRADIDRIRQ